MKKTVLSILMLSIFLFLSCGDESKKDNGDDPEITFNDNFSVGYHKFHKYLSIIFEREPGEFHLRIIAAYKTDISNIRLFGKGVILPNQEDDNILDLSFSPNLACYNTFECPIMKDDVECSVKAGDIETGVITVDEDETKIIYITKENCSVGNQLPITIIVPTSPDISETEYPMEYPSEDSSAKTTNLRCNVSKLGEDDYLILATGETSDGDYIEMAFDTNNASNFTKIGGYSNPLNSSEITYTEEGNYLTIEYAWRSSTRVLKCEMNKYQYHE